MKSGESPGGLKYVHPIEQGSLSLTPAGPASFSELPSKLVSSIEMSG